MPQHKKKRSHFLHRAEARGSRPTKSGGIKTEYKSAYRKETATPKFL